MADEGHPPLTSTTLEPQSNKQRTLSERKKGVTPAGNKSSKTIITKPVTESCSRQETRGVTTGTPGSAGGKITGSIVSPPASFSLPRSRLDDQGGAVTDNTQPDPQTTGLVQDTASCILMVQHPSSNGAESLNPNKRNDVFPVHLAKGGSAGKRKGDVVPPVARRKSPRNANYSNTLSTNELNVREPRPDTTWSLHKDLKRNTPGIPGDNRKSEGGNSPLKRTTNNVPELSRDPAGSKASTDYTHQDLGPKISRHRVSFHTENVTLDIRSNESTATCDHTEKVKTMGPSSESEPVSLKVNPAAANSRVTRQVQVEPGPPIEFNMSNVTRDLEKEKETSLQKTNTSSFIRSSSDLYTETDSFGDSFYLDTQTARLVSAEAEDEHNTGGIKPEGNRDKEHQSSCEDALSLRLETDSSTDTNSAQSMSNNRAHKDKENINDNDGTIHNITKGDFQPAPCEALPPDDNVNIQERSPVLYSENPDTDLSMDFDLENYMDAYCTQRDVVAQTASPSLAPSINKATVLPAVAGQRSRLPPQVAMTHISATAQMTGSRNANCHAQKGLVSEDDVLFPAEQTGNMADETVLVYSGCTQRLPYMEDGQLALEKGKNILAPSSSKEPSGVKTDGLENRIQNEQDHSCPAKNISTVCTSLQEDFLVAMDMDNNFSTPSNMGAVQKSISDIPQETEPGRQVSQSCEMGCGVFDDSFTFSMIQRVPDGQSVKSQIHVQSNLHNTMTDRHIKSNIPSIGIPNKQTCDNIEVERNPNVGNTLARIKQTQVREASMKTSTVPVPGTSRIGYPVSIPGVSEQVRSAKRRGPQPKVCCPPPKQVRTVRTRGNTSPQGTSPARRTSLPRGTSSPGGISPTTGCRVPQNDSAASDCIPPTPPDQSFDNKPSTITPHHGTIARHTPKRTPQGARGTPRQGQKPKTTPGTKAYQNNNSNSKASSQSKADKPTRPGLRPRNNPTTKTWSSSNLPNVETDKSKERAVSTPSLTDGIELDVSKTSEEGSDSELMKATPPNNNPRKSQRCWNGSSRKNKPGAAVQMSRLTVHRAITSSSRASSITPTRQSFTIVDTAGNRLLFEDFIGKWKTKTSYAICLSCEKVPVQPANPSAVIGGNFTKKGTGEL